MERGRRGEWAAGRPLAHPSCFLLPPANSKPTLSILQGGFLWSEEEKVGRALASSLLLPLWIASLFSRHFICSGILSQLKTREAYISSNPDVPASWSAPGIPGKTSSPQPTSPRRQSPSVVPTAAAHREEAQVSQAWCHLWACTSEKPPFHVLPTDPNTRSAGSGGPAASVTLALALSPLCPGLAPPPMPQSFPNWQEEGVLLQASELSPLKMLSKPALLFPA